jgi:hypothetical protein
LSRKFFDNPNKHGGNGPQAVENLWKEASKPVEILLKSGRMLHIPGREHGRTGSPSAGMQSVNAAIERMSIN